jgi:hypothetical protein
MAVNRSPASFEEGFAAKARSPQAGAPGAKAHLREVIGGPSIAPHVNDNATLQLGNTSAFSPRRSHWDTAGAPNVPEGTVKMSDPTREEIQAQIAASEARGETKFARLEGKLDLVLSKIDNSNSHYSDLKADIADSRRSTVANVWVVFGTVVALLIGLVAAAPAIFDLGSKFRETITKEVQDRIPQNASKK